VSSRAPSGSSAEGTTRSLTAAYLRGPRRKISPCPCFAQGGAGAGARDRGGGAARPQSQETQPCAFRSHHAHLRSRGCPARVSHPGATTRCCTHAGAALQGSSWGPGRSQDEIRGMEFLRASHLIDQGPIRAETPRSNPVQLVKALTKYASFSPGGARQGATALAAGSLLLQCARRRGETCQGG